MNISPIARRPSTAVRIGPVTVGALIGGLLIGCAEVFSGQYLADYTSTLGNGYSLIVPYVVMLVVLLVRPYGLFGTPEIRRV